MSTVDYSTRICCTYMIIIKYLYTCLDKAFHLSNCDWKQDQVMRARADVEVGLGIIMVVGVQTWFDGSSVIELYLSQRSQKGLKCVSCHDHFIRKVYPVMPKVSYETVSGLLWLCSSNNLSMLRLLACIALPSLSSFFGTSWWWGLVVWWGHDQAEWWKT